MRTVIVGNSGSGKTSLAKRLGANSAARIVHLDEIFWLPGGFNQQRAPSDVSALIEAEKSTPEWIVEGVYGDLANRFLPAAQTFLWLDLPWPVCKQRLEARGSESKTHMGRKQSEQGLRDLLQWAEGYYSRSGSCGLAAHLGLFESFPRERLRFQSEAEVTEYLKIADIPIG